MATRAAAFSTDQRTCMRRAAVAVALVLALGLQTLPDAWAAMPSVTLAGILGSKALLVIDGQARTLGAGEALQGVRVVAVGRTDATVEVDGRRAVLQMGGTPALIGNATPSGTGRRIVMTSDGAGHFRPQGSINGQVTQFLVDTGATVVALGQSEAERLGLDYRSGQAVYMSTANGNARGWRLRLSAVRIGDVTIYDVDAVVTPQPMPYVLLGNSYLTQFQMTRTNDQMVLDKRF